MSKYSDEFKLKVVQCYLKNGGYGTTAYKFGIPTFDTVRKWVKKYEEHGEKGLINNIKTSYSGEFKQNVLEYMHYNHLSCQEASHHFNLGCVSVISKCKRIYYKEGPQALYEERRGRNKNMSSNPRKKKISKENEEDLIEKVIAIYELRHEFKLEALLKYAEVTRSTFYYQLNKLRQPDKYKEITAICHENKGRYGYRRITLELHNRGFGINHKTVRKLMKKLGLQCFVRVQNINHIKVK